VNPRYLLLTEASFPCTHIFVVGTSHLPEKVKLLL